MPIPVSDIKQKLGQLHIRVAESWLDGCINYFLTEERNIKINDLLEKVKEQWSLENLEEIGLPCLPVNIVSAHQESKPKTLNGRFVLQMQYVIDISEPAYNQLEKLNNITRQILENEKTTEKVHDTRFSRMLKMELTDGQNKVVAVEYRPIPALNTNLKPGIKIMLIGPIKIGANRTLFLESKNVNIIGGEVDSIMEANCPENVLLRSLGLPEKKGNLFGDRVSVPRSGNRDRAPITSTAAPSVRQIDQRNYENDLQPIAFNQSQVNLVLDDDLLFDNEILDDLEQDFNEPFEENVAQNTAGRTEWPQENEVTDEDFMDIDDGDQLLLQVDENVLTAYDNETSSMSSSTVERRSYNKQKINNMFTTSTSSHQIGVAPQKPTIVARIKKEIIDSDYPIKVDELPLAYIKQINVVKNNLVTSKTFAVIAEVEDVTSKLSFVNGTWRLAVIITDRISKDTGSGGENDINISINSNILEELIGYSVDEMAELSKRKQDPGVKRDLLIKLADVQEKFESEIFLFHVKICKDNMPAAVELKSLTNMHKSIMFTKRQYD